MTELSAYECNVCGKALVSNQANYEPSRVLTLKASSESVDDECTLYLEDVCSECVTRIFSKAKELFGEKVVEY